MAINRSMEELASLFQRFPGIGPRQAERFAQFIAQSNRTYVHELTGALTKCRGTSKQCPSCFLCHDRDEALCLLCADEARDGSLLVVVEKDRDVRAFEESGVAQGRYFVLGGLIPIASDIEKHVRLPQLQHKVRDEAVREVLLAFSYHPDADHTIRVVMERLQTERPDINVSVLGRGLSAGSELEYTDIDTMRHAFDTRTNRL